MIIVGSQCHDLLWYRYIVHPYMRVHSNCESALGPAWECTLILGCTWIVGVHLDHGSTWIMWVCLDCVSALGSW